MRIEEASFTVFDVETTGLYPYHGDRICEIGAVRIGPQRKPSKTFHSMVDPEMPISSGAFYVNRITPEMLENQPTISQILPDFLSFMEGSVLVAYNAGFDLGFLASALGEGKDILDQYDVIDALALARRLFPGIRRYNLGSVANALSIDSSGEHRAMADVFMTLGVFQKELDVLVVEGAQHVCDIISAQTNAVSVKAACDDMIKLFTAAIRGQQKVIITYRSSWDGQTTTRTVTPLEIRTGYDRSYLVAHCHLKDEKRNFRLDCVLEANISA